MKIKFKTKVYWFFAPLITFSICFQVQAGINNNGIAINMVGKVEVDGQNAYNGIEVGPRSSIKTFEKSFIEVVFNEKNMFKIFENSVAVLDLDSQEKSINLRSGAISNLIKILDTLSDKFRTRYTVATAVAVAGVRGTSFFVKVEDSKNTYICV